MAVKKLRLLKYTLIALFVFGINVGITKADEYQNYYGITMTNEEYNNLINLGFLEDEIYYMDLETFNANKDSEATLVAQVTKYYKTEGTAFDNLYGQGVTTEITKEEYDSQSEITPRGSVSTDYKTMVTSISQNGNQYRYKVSLSWKIMPSVRNYDIIAIGFSGNVYINSSIYFNYHHCNSSGTCTTASDYYDKMQLSGGGSTVYKLPSSAVSLSSTLYFDVSKTNSNTITGLAMCGDYAHATSSVSTSYLTNYTIHETTGLVLGTYLYDKYDEIPCAPATWSGTW